MPNMSSWRFTACGFLVVLALGAATETACAEGCVIGLTLSGSKRTEAKAVGDVVAVNTYASLAACNSAMAAMADALPNTPAADAFPAESLTFVCKVPDDCTVSDARVETPFSRVVLLHIRDSQ